VVIESFLSIFGCACCLLTLIFRIGVRIQPARLAAIKTYDQRRMLGGSTEDAKTAAFMAQAYHICSAFSFLAARALCWAACAQHRHPTAG